MGLVVFPMLGEGLFATGTSFSATPAMFSLAMLLTYSVTMDVAYAVMLRDHRPE